MNSRKTSNSGAFYSSECKLFFLHFLWTCGIINMNKIFEIHYANTFERRKFSLLQRNDTCSQTSGNYMNALESKWIQKIIKVHLGFMESACNYRFLNEQMVHEVHLTENKSKRWKMNSVLFLIAMINNVPPKCIQWSSHIWVPFRIKR